MNGVEAFKISIDMANMICTAYVQDLTDEQLMMRPSPGCNHINWQLGHLIASEHEMIEQVAPGSMPALPDGFAEKYTKATAASDDTSAFESKDVLMATYSQQREGTLAALAKQSESDFDKPTGVDYAPTVGAMFGMQGAHWLMHCGQWVVVRRQLGLPAMF